jgi:hypothetical protein
MARNGINWTALIIMAMGGAMLYFGVNGLCGSGFHPLCSIIGSVTIQPILSIIGIITLIIGVVQLARR